MSEATHIGFIGAGNMGRSLIGGLLKHGHPAERLLAAEPSQAGRARIEALGVRTTPHNERVVEEAQLVVLAVKPQVLRDVLVPLAALLRRRRPLLLSIAAGVRSDAIRSWIGDPRLPVVRAMPNTPSLLGCGVAGLHASEGCSRQQRDAAAAVLAATGHVEWVAEEALLDAVTAVSGSGPAYFFLLMEAIAEAGAKLGLSAELSRRLTVHTALGAARMATESTTEPAELRRQVTSPGGTTEAALRVLEEAGLREVIERALTAAQQRGAELAAELAGDD